jgi:hypothetical protein
MYAYEGGDFITGVPRLAVAAEVNRRASPGSGRSHFLGVFAGEPCHVIAGESDDWEDMEEFAVRALEVVVEHYSLPAPPTEIEVPTRMRRAFQLPSSYHLESPSPPPETARCADTPARVPARKWWQFWK